MFRFLIAAAAIALSTAPSLANGHGGGDAPPPPKPATSPAKVILTKQGPTLVDLNGMTLYYWVPLSATADAKAIGDFTVISRNDGSKMWAYRYRPLYTSPADKAPGEANGNATTLQWRVARPEN